MYIKISLVYESQNIYDEMEVSEEYVSNLTV
jgi:hypothetical protein